MKSLLFAWFLFMTTASFWLAPYKGGIDVGIGGAAAAATAYALVAVLAAVGVCGRVESRRDALVSTLPTVLLLAAAALAGYLLNKQRAEFRGEAIFLYYGVTPWASWGRSLPPQPSCGVGMASRESSSTSSSQPFGLFAFGARSTGDPMSPSAAAGFAGRGLPANADRHRNPRESS